MKLNISSELRYLKWQMIFDGKTSFIKERYIWYRLIVDDFQKAVNLLKTNGLIQEFRNSLVLPSPYIKPPELLKFLIQNGFEVSEFCRNEETLESFYLSLMHKDEKTIKNLTVQSLNCVG
jgi:hypothetical protein